MINEKYYIVLSEVGYTSKEDAYDDIRRYYNGVSGVTTYYDRGLWYIVRSKALMWAREEA